MHMWHCAPIKQQPENPKL